MSRDNARTPMQWDASAHAGFTEGEPWIPVNPNHAEINARAAVEDPESVFHHYRRLIELRRTEPAVVYGDFTMLLEDDARIYAFTRRHADTELLVVANFSGGPASAAAIPDAERWAEAELLIANVRGRGEAPFLQLEPWEARVYRRA
jgi:oligo-1,6-glucosidase